MASLHPARIHWVNTSSVIITGTDICNGMGININTSTSISASIASSTNTSTNISTGINTNTNTSTSTRTSTTTNATINANASANTTASINANIIISASTGTDFHGRAPCRHAPGRQAGG